MAMKYVGRVKLKKEEIELLKEGEKALEFLRQNSKEIWERYKGKYVAIMGEEIISADTFAELRKKMGERKGIILKVPYKEKIWIL